MYYFFKSMPLWLYTVCGLGFIGFGIWAVIDLLQRKPGHPMRFFMYAMMVTVFLLVVHRFVFTFSASPVLQKASDIVVEFSIFILAILFFVDTTLSVKRGYGTGTVKELWSNFGVYFAILAGLIIFLLIVVNMG